MTMLLQLLVLFALCIPVVQGQSDEQKFCKQQKEVVFMLDASRSVDGRNFVKVKNFTRTMIGYLDVRPEATRVAVVSFSIDVCENIGLGNYSTVEQLQQAVDGIEYLNQEQTQTDDALKYVRESVFSSDHENYTQIVICVTDGEPTEIDKLRNEVNASRLVGIDIIAIGVGRNLQVGLQALATENDQNQDLIYSVNDFDDLRMLVNNLSLQLCASECQNKKLDLALVLDRSTSVGENNFAKVVNFTMSIVNRLNIGQDGTRVTLLAYSTTVTPFFPLDEHDSKSELLSAMDNVQYTNGGNTYTHLALDSARYYLTDTQLGSREEANKVAIVVTDGRAQFQTATETAAQQLRDADVTVIAIGVGDIQEGVLEDIATTSDDPDESYVFNQTNYNTLDSIVYAVTHLACKD